MKLYDVKGYKQFLQSENLAKERVDLASFLKNLFKKWTNKIKNSVGTENIAFKVANYVKNSHRSENTFKMLHQ